MSKQAETLQELRSKSDTDLQKQLGELREQLRVLTFKVHGSEVKNVHEALKIRRQIARLLTVMSEKRIISGS